MLSHKTDCFSVNFCIKINFLPCFNNLDFLCNQCEQDYTKPNNVMKLSERQGQRPDLLGCNSSGFIFNVFILFIHSFQLRGYSSIYFK